MNFTVCEEECRDWPIKKIIKEMFSLAVRGLIQTHIMNMEERIKSKVE